MEFKRNSFLYCQTSVYVCVCVFSFLFLFILVFCSKIVHENRTNLAHECFLNDLKFILLRLMIFFFSHLLFSVFYQIPPLLLPSAWYIQGLYFHLGGMLIRLSVRRSSPNFLHFCYTITSFAFNLSLFEIEIL